MPKIDPCKAFACRIQACLKGTGLSGRHRGYERVLQEVERQKFRLWRYRHQRKKLILIVYGVYHDEISEVKYTDIDYKVFTDASRHLLNGNSPYDRHTFRYSPLIAILLIPNLTLHHTFGKIIFSLIDIIVALLIRLLVKNAIREYYCHDQKSSIEDNSQSKQQNIRSRKKLRQSNKQRMNFTKTELQSKTNVDVVANIAMISWLYNPLTIAIGTRGNCDSIAGFLVLSTLYFVQCKRSPFIAGLIHGLSIHFRLYPIIYSLTLYMFLSKFSFYSPEDKKRPLPIQGNSNNQLENVQTSSTGSHKVMPFVDDVGRKTIFKKEYLMYLIPNLEQLKLILGCLLSLCFLTWFFYHLFGYKFLYETYIYHLIRKDTRHNFSLYFYLHYLSAWVKNIGIWQKVLTVLPQLVLIVVLSVHYGLNKFALNFAVLTQTMVMVIYNGVLTSQYFVWILAVLPLCLWQINMSMKMAFFLALMWFVAQGVWLLPAYLLEFHGQNTFFYIWIQSVSFFCANIAILGRFIMYFTPRKEKMC
ncbi:hypothetical protein JTB14_001327 [Gonioctena quinquepunctata]|nr:hypothetical protein JTB14_001327 [Gonioctena quinquepunctata]